MHDDDDFDGIYVSRSSYFRPLLLAATVFFTSVALLSTGAYIGVIYIRDLQENIHRGTPP
jgi:hypothetical protein